MENVVHIFGNNFANVGMKPEAKLQYIFDIYLHNKNTLEYAKIAGSAPKSMILYIKGRSKKYLYFFIKSASNKLSAATPKNILQLNCTVVLCFHNTKTCLL